MVEVHHPQEVLQLLSGGLRQQVSDDSDPVRQGFNAGDGDPVAQEIELWLPKLTFFSVGCEPGCQQGG